METRDPETVARHQRYIDCLRGTGVEVRLAHFKKAPLRCPHCSKKIVRHEEKETDVAIAAQLLKLLHGDECDVAVLVTGDSDQVPAVQMATALFGNRRVFSCFTFDRVSDELKRAAAGYFKVSAAHYLRHQLPDPFITRHDGRLAKPEGW